MRELSPRDIRFSVFPGLAVPFTSHEEEMPATEERVVSADSVDRHRVDQRFSDASEDRYVPLCELLWLS
jgi:hypothetical protein